MKPSAARLFAACLFAAAAPRLPATDYFVSILKGSDTNPGTPAQPFKTIAKALSVARSGDRVFVMPGRYAISTGEVLPLTVPRGVQVLGTERRACLLDGEGQRAVLITLQNNCVLRRFTLRSGRIGWWDRAILVQDSTSGDAVNVEIDHLQLDEVPRGIIVGFATGTHNVSNVRIHDVAITRCFVEGINSWTNGGKSSGNKIWNCTIAGHPDPKTPTRSVMRAAISIGPGTQFDVRNCILATYDFVGLEASGAGGNPPPVTSDHNLFWSFKGSPVSSGLKLGTNDQTGKDPLLCLAPAAATFPDVHLTGFRSPCYQKGINQTNQANDVEWDFAASRLFAGVVDIGVDELRGFDAWVSGPAVAGGRLRLGLSGTPSAPALFAIGFQVLPQGITVPGIGGKLWLTPGKPIVFVPAVKDARGYGRIVFPLPRQPSLAGLVLYLQGLETKPALLLSDLDRTTLLR